MFIWQQENCTKGSATACGPSRPPAWRSSSPGTPWAGPRGHWGRSWTFRGQLWGKTVPEDLRYKSYVTKRGKLMSEHSQARKRTEDWLKKNPSEVSEKNVWPPSWPDCRLLDYFVWGVSELQDNAQPHKKIEDLIHNMKVVMGSLDRDTKAKTCQRLRSKIKDVVTADSNFIA